MNLRRIDSTTMYRYEKEREEQLRKEEKRRKKRSEKRQKRRLRGLSLVFQVAGISLIVMNMTLLGETLYNLMDQGGTLYEAVVIPAAILNILELINNWSSISQYIRSYRKVSLFAADLLTLGLFYIQVYVLARIAETDSPSDKRLWFGFILMTYLCLYTLYTWWNILIGQSENISCRAREKIMAVTRWREYQLLFGTAVLSGLMVLENLELPVSSTSWAMAWAAIIWIYLGVAAIILFLSQKLLKMLKIAMEAEYTH